MRGISLVSPKILTCSASCKVATVRGNLKHDGIGLEEAASVGGASERGLQFAHEIAGSVPILHLVEEFGKDKSTTDACLLRIRLISRFKVSRVLLSPFTTVVPTLDSLVEM